MDEPHVDAGLRDQPARVLELPRRVVEADGAGAALREQDRPLRSAAAELEHVLAGNIAEDPQLRLGDLPHPPSWLRAADELAVALLVLVAQPVPGSTVALRVRRAQRAPPDHARLRSIHLFWSR